MSSFCELALALVCSIRHNGLNDIQTLSFNASILARELERVLVLCPDPRRLEPLLSLMSAVQRADLGTDPSVAQKTSAGMSGVFSAEIVQIFQTLALHPDSERTSRWQQRCANLLGVLPLEEQGAKHVALTKADEAVLRKLDTFLARADQHFADKSHANAGGGTEIVAQEIGSLVLKAYQDKVHTAWLWSR